MKRKYDAVYTEKYTDKQTGEERKKHTKVGVVIERDDGSLCMKMMGSWINFYEPRANEKDYKKAREAVQETQTYGHDLQEDTIPF